MSPTPPPASAAIRKPSRQQRVNALRYELEDIIIGAVLVDASGYAQVADILRPGTFISKRHLFANSTVWQAIQTAAKQGPVDIMTVTRMLYLGQPETDAAHPIQSVGWHVARYTDRVASAVNLRHHALCLFEYALREQAVAILRQAANGELGDLTELEAFLADETRDIHQDIHRATAFLRSHGYPEVAEVMQELGVNVSERLRQMSRQSWVSYIKQQYQYIIEQENNGSN